MPIGDGSLQQAFGDVTAASNLKVVSEGVAFWHNMMYKDALEDSRALGTIRLAAVGDIVQSMNDRSQAVDAVSSDRVLNGNFMGSQIAQLAAALSANGQFGKVLEQTPPQVVITKAA